MSTRIKIPLVIGRNRLRGKSEGAMVDDTEFDHLTRLRRIMATEARAQSIEATKEWLDTAIIQVLKLYEQALKEWQSNKDGCIGFIYEACLPSGEILLLGDARTLARVK